MGYFRAFPYNNVKPLFTAETVRKCAFLLFALEDLIGRPGHEEETPAQRRVLCIPNKECPVGVFVRKEPTA